MPLMEYRFIADFVTGVPGDSPARCEDVPAEFLNRLVSDAQAWSRNADGAHKPLERIGNRSGNTTNTQFIFLLIHGIAPITNALQFPLQIVQGCERIFREPLQSLVAYDLSDFFRRQSAQYGFTQT